MFNIVVLRIKDYEEFGSVIVINFGLILIFGRVANNNSNCWATNLFIRNPNCSGEMNLNTWPITLS